MVGHHPDDGGGPGRSRQRRRGPNTLPALSSTISVVHGAAASSNASSRTNAPSYWTGPVISTWSSAERHSIVELAARQAHGSLPFHQPQPRRRDQGRAGGRSAGEHRPTPRSHTRALTTSRASTSAKVTLAFSGSMGWTSILAPSAERIIRCDEKPSCGLPMFEEAGPSAFGPPPSGQRWTRRVSATARRRRNGVPSEPRRPCRHDGRAGPDARRR